MKYFISDTHFLHAGSLKWNNGTVRPDFKDVEEMNEHMISKWNLIVKPEDEVYFLGDFAYKCNKNKAEIIFWRLNGKKHLIKGNHDFELASKFINCWESISDMKTIEIELPNGCKKEIVLCHYPMISWRHKEAGAWHLHGHTHGSIQELNRGTHRYDVGVEVNDYCPLSEWELIQKLNF